MNIPFEDRCLELPSGFNVIWPFRNQEKMSVPQELILDSNAFIRSHWLKDAYDLSDSYFTLTPIHAFFEQWISNKDFRKKGADKVDSYLKGFIDMGVNFSPGVSDDIIKILKKNDSQIRTTWMTGYLYAVLLYQILSAKKGDDTPERKFETIFDKDVPIFSGLNMLCVLAIYLKKNQRVTMLGDKNKAFSYLASFSSMHTSKKGEKSINERYLMNRAGDLSFWMFAPMLVQLNYENVGQLAVVTNDKALKKLIFRCIPAVLTPSGQMAFSFDERCFDFETSRDICEEIYKVSERQLECQNRRAAKGNGLDGPMMKLAFLLRIKSRKKEERKIMLRRLENLKNHITQEANQDITDSVEKVWNEWIIPGFFRKVEL